MKFICHFCEQHCELCMEGANPTTYCPYDGDEEHVEWEVAE